MALDYATLESLRQNHPAWRLLRAEHAALIASFLHDVFVAPNVRVIGQSDLAEALDDVLFALRERFGPERYPKAALAYLNDWTAADKGWLRKFYRHGSDEPQFDLTPATEKAIGWLGSLAERSFVGTESRLLMLFDLLQQLSDGSQTDTTQRVAELEKRRAEIDAELIRARAGELSLLDDTAVRDRFQQFTQLARELLADFREVEHNFRGLDRRVRERITLWAGSKGELLEEIMGERDAIADSDQGRSFRGFWDFLMSSQRQETLSAQLDQVLALPAISELAPDPRLRRVHYDWLEAGEHTQRTVALLSQQLRRFLDDKAWLENRRIMDILKDIETRALALRDAPPRAPMASIDSIGASINLPLERPLYTPSTPTALHQLALEAGDQDMDAAALYAQVIIDKVQLKAQIGRALATQPQVRLASLCAAHPLQHGLAELIAYLQLSGDFHTVVDEAHSDEISWTVADAEPTRRRSARLPRVIFVRAVS